MIRNDKEKIQVLQNVIISKCKLRDFVIIIIVWEVEKRASLTVVTSLPTKESLQYRLKLFVHLHAQYCVFTNHVYRGMTAEQQWWMKTEMKAMVYELQ